MSEKIGSLSIFDGFGLIVGTVIGSGIFSSPGLTLKHAGSPSAALFAWSAASILSIITATCYFELGCMMPSAGGDYEYLNKAYGDRVAFSFAWFNFFVSKPGSLSIIATIFGSYIETIIAGHSTFDVKRQTSTSFTAQISAILLILVLTLINCYGLRESATLQNTLTTIKLLLIVLIFIFGAIYAVYDPTIMNHNLSLTTSPNSFTHSNDILSFGAAMIACLWSYNGWQNTVFFMEDLRNSLKNLPRVVFSGIIVVTISYLSANIAYLFVMPKKDIMNSLAIAYEMGQNIAMKIPHTQYLSLVFAIGVVLSTCGAVHGEIMTGGKALYAVARAGRAPALLKRMNTRHSPYIALICQGIWTIIILSLPSTNFSSLLSFYGSATWCFYSLSSSAIIRLRYTQPYWNRPYKLPFYPLPIIIVILFSIIIIISSFLTEPLYTALAFGFIFISIPIHILLEFFHRSPVEDVTNTHAPYLSSFRARYLDTIKEVKEETTITVECTKYDSIQKYTIYYGI